MKSILPETIRGGATFDRSRKYRYHLWRHWDASLPKLTMLMLNPSAADAQFNDPTIASCIRIASRSGFGSLHVVNLFAYRAAEPANLKQAADPVGRANNKHIKRAMSDSHAVLLAWGNHGLFMDRHVYVNRLLSDYDGEIFCLGITKLGQPRHPLYLPANIELQRWMMHTTN